MRLSHPINSMLTLIVLPSLLLGPMMGCMRQKPGQADVPPGIKAIPGRFVDLNPRWSHRGDRIAFMRRTTDRKMQLHMVQADLSAPTPLFQAELLCPDRPYASALASYSSPDSIDWSSDDNRIAFERIEWFRFDNGDRLPGTGLWMYDFRTQTVSALALHPKDYKDQYYYYHAARWSPDNRYLAFVGETTIGGRVIGVTPVGVREAKKAITRYDRYNDSDWPVWHDNRLAYRQGIVFPTAGWRTETLRYRAPGVVRQSAAGELWRIRSEELRPLLKDYDPHVGIAQRAAHLTWSPNGKQLAFSLTPDPNNYNRYELWVWDGTHKGGGIGNARRVSKQDGRGYIAPVWIGEEMLGALSPNESGYDVVTINILTGEKRTLGTIPTSDCDWSPDRTRIVYAMPPDDLTHNPKTTMLRILNLKKSL